MTDRPPVALGRLNDESKHVWLSPRPVGVFDWVMTLGLCVLAVPVLVVFGLILVFIWIFGGKGR